MKTLSAILVCLMLIIGGCKTGGSSSGGGGGGGGADLSIPAAGPEDYTDEDYEWLFKMWEEYNIAYTDADKTGSDDSNLCWAATAANLLAWGGWAADEDDVFNTFNEHFANQPGDVYDALRYYFNNFIPNVSAEMVTVREARSRMLLDFVVSALHEGRGVTLKIKYPGRSIGHFVTVFGYMYLTEEDNFVLMFTDSDDHLNQMRNFKVVWNDGADRWEIQGVYSDWYLEYVVSLDTD